jgi:hypothetical protein
MHKRPIIFSNINYILCSLYLKQALSCTSFSFWHYWGLAMNCVPPTHASHITEIANACHHATFCVKIWSQTTTLLMSTFWVTGITNVSHHAWFALPFFETKVFAIAIIKWPQNFCNKLNNFPSRSKENTSWDTRPLVCELHYPA